jgi:hypothetical protein
MLRQGSRNTFADWKRLTDEFDTSFEVVFLFGLLGIAVTLMCLTVDPTFDVGAGPITIVGHVR